MPPMDTPLPGTIPSLPDRPPAALYARVDPNRVRDARILIADGRPDRRRFLHNMLYQIGVRQIAEAVDGVGALEQIDVYSPDAVMVDSDISGLDATEMIRIVRSDVFVQNELPIIVTTASISRKRANDLLFLGVNEILMRPFSIAGLFSHVDMVVNKPRAFIKSDGYFGPEPRERMIGYGKFVDAIQKSAGKSAAAAAAA